MQYFPMALFVNAEGRNPRQLIEARHRTELTQWERYADGAPADVRVEVSILSSGDACAECARHNGRTYRLDVALRERPLPVAGCSHIIKPGSHAFCRCIYQFDADV